MAFEDLAPDPLIPEEPPPPEEASNRPFLIAMGVLGLMLLLGLGCLGAYIFYYVPQQREAQVRATQQAQQVEQANQKILMQTIVAEAVSQTSAVLSQTPAATFTPVPPTNTPVVVIADTATPTPGPHTATVSALLTQAAQMQLTQTPGAEGGEAEGTATPTSLTGMGSGGSSGSVKGQSQAALPKAGFADAVGLPGLLGMSFALIGLIVLARRLRSTLN